jgi:preprotein translocase subunit SecD
VLHVARWRVFAVIIVSLLGLIYALPNVLPASVRAAMPSWIPSKTINLGLDLQGGSYLMFEVESEAVYKARLETVADDLSRDLRGQRRPGDLTGATKTPIVFSGLSAGATGQLVRVTITNPADMPEAIKRAKALGTPVQGLNGPTGSTDLALVTQPNNVIEIALTEDAKTALTRRAVTQSIEVIRRRIDETGTKEPAITRQGIDRIVLQAPGESDPEKLKRLVGKTARLTFQMVDESVTTAEAMAGRIPPGAELLDLPLKEGGPKILVRKRAIVSGDNLVDAQPGFDQQKGIPNVSFRFDGAGGKSFGRATQDNVGKRFAIVLDNNVISAPQIKTAILTGDGQISGGFATLQEASELAVLLRAGALPAPLKVMEQRTVGPEQGKDSITAGANAGLIAMALIVLFMFLAYGFVFGGISIIALTINLILILAAMTAFGATLTLPGIAGLILTIGAAVDANVLIYERMREEELSGRSTALAIDAGFKRAIITVMDANVTALLTALILFYFGAGPVKGFAWTLSIGVITSMFTAILMTQVLVAAWYWRVKPKRLPI